MSMLLKRSLIAVLVLIAAGCGTPAGTPGVGPVPASAQATDSANPRNTAATLVPTGFGSLRQDEVTVSLRQGAVLVKVVPLDEATIRLLAPDTYNRLRALRETRLADAKRSTPRPELFLVSFFSYQPDVAFQPEDVQLMHQSKLLRPLKVLPQTTGWGQQRLGQQETQLAIYVFEGPIDYEQQIVVRYGQDESDQWQTMLTKLEQERARIRARVKG
jgi:hypothetical protein